MTWACAAIVLIGSTWRLWTGFSNFPQIPLLEPLVSAPVAADWFALGMLLLSVAFLLVSSLRQVLRYVETPQNVTDKFACVVFIVSVLCLFLLNQHRLQPWAWQFLLYAVLFTFANRAGDFLASARWLTASIYFFSAISKFDYQFIYGLGGRLAQTLAEIIGVEPVGWMSLTATSMPVFELLIAILLIVGRTRKMGVALAVVFHAALIVTLGPWGLNHHTGVLIWNLFFLAITVILFWPTTAEQDASEDDGRSAVMFTLTLAMVLYPLLPNCDHWLAWGLYSPNNSRCALETIQENDEGETVFLRVDLSKLSLEQLNVPLYPEARFQLGVAQAIQQRENMTVRSRIVIKSRSNRFNGQRESSIFEETDQWNRKQSNFIFNWQPRSF